MLLYSMIGTTFAGICVVAALTMNRYDLPSILISAAIGALLAMPAAWLVARRLQAL